MNIQNPLGEFLSQLSRMNGPAAVTDALAWLGAFAITQDGVVIAANEAFCAIMEKDAQNVIGTSALDFIVTDEKTSMRSRLASNDVQPYTLRLTLSHDRIKLVHVTPQLLNLDGKTCRLAAFSDVSEYAALKSSGGRYQKVFSAAGIGIARVSLDGHWLECNAKLCEILGYDENELLRMSVQASTHPDDLLTDQGYVKEMLAGTRSTYSVEKRFRKKAGSYIWVRLTVTLVKNLVEKPLYFVSLTQEITAEKKAEAATQRLNQALENLSFTDGLTGIGNRRKFDTALHNEWRRARREKTSIALILADIDHFKLFNDQLGHLAGDDCLKDIATTLEKYANRVSDCVARYGGEEFAILLPGVSLDDAVDIAEECRKAVEDLGICRDGEGGAALTTISLGVAEAYPDERNTPELLIDAADQKMYDAKRAGRNKVMPEPKTIPSR